MLSETGVFGFLQIYSDWANHYLEKAKCKRRIRDLQADVADGVLLADVVEAVSKYLLAHFNYPTPTARVASSRGTFWSPNGRSNDTDVF